MIQITKTKQNSMRTVQIKLTLMKMKLKKILRNKAQEIEKIKQIHLKISVIIHHKFRMTQRRMRKLKQIFKLMKL